MAIGLATMGGPPLSNTAFRPDRGESDRVAASGDLSRKRLFSRWKLSQCCVLGIREESSSRRKVEICMVTTKATCTADGVVP